MWLHIFTLELFGNNYANSWWYGGFVMDREGYVLLCFVVIRVKAISFILFYLFSFNRMGFVNEYLGGILTFVCGRGTTGWKSTFTSPFFLGAYVH